MDFRNKIERTVSGNLSPIQMDNGLTMSIQASETHYSEPRSLVPISQYTAFEVAFLKGGFSFVDPLNCLEYDQVMAYVPTEQVQSLYDRASKLSSEYVSKLKEL